MTRRVPFDNGDSRLAAAGVTRQMLREATDLRSIVDRDKTHQTLAAGEHLLERTAASLTG